MPSTLTLPGPHNTSVRKPAKKSVAFSPILKKSMWWTLNSATDMLTINGIATSLVNKPIVINKAQKNSAKMDKISEGVDPIPAKL